MTNLLSLEEWRARYVVFCERCEKDTLPLRNGTCGFCDDKIAAAEPRPAAEPKPDQKPCAVCGDEIPPVFGHQRGQGMKLYCSQNCKKQAYRLRSRVSAPPLPPLPDRMCVKCGDWYPAHRAAPHQRFCSAICRSRTNDPLYRARKRAAA